MSLLPTMNSRLPPNSASCLQQHEEWSQGSAVTRSASGGPRARNLSPERSPELIFKPPPRRGPPLEGPVEHGLAYGEKSDLVSDCHPRPTKTKRSHSQGVPNKTKCWLACEEKTKKKMTPKRSREDLLLYDPTHDDQGLPSDPDETESWKDDEWELIDTEEQTQVNPLGASHPESPIGMLPAPAIEGELIPACLEEVGPVSVETKCLVRELKAQGPKALKAWKSALKDGEQQLRTVKLCFVGHARAGKTSTLASLSGQAFDPTEPSTHGVRTASFKNELMRASPTNWGKLDGSISDLMERCLAQTVLKTMIGISRSKSAPPTLPARGDEEGAGEPAVEAATTPNITETGPKTHQCSSANAEVYKMPVDLIVRAVSSTAPAHIATGDIVKEESEEVVMQTWDFAGDDLYYSMAHVFLTRLGLYCLTMDLSKWASDEPSEDAAKSLDFWLSALFVHAKEARIIIVGTHIDAIPEDERDDLYERVDQYLEERLRAIPEFGSRLHVNEEDGYFFFPVDNSRKTPEGRASVAKLRNELNRLALEFVQASSKIPTRWAYFFQRLTQELESESNGDKQPKAPYRSMDKIQKLAYCSGIKQEGELEACLTTFHQLGQLLYFKNSPAVVLEPQWLLDAMAQVAGCPRALKEDPIKARELSSRGELSEVLLKFLWRDEKFWGHEDILRRFLEHFDLLVPDARKPNATETKWLVPSLLPERKRNAKSRQLRPEPAVRFYLDFLLSFRRLLVTLIPRLLCHLQRNEQCVEVYDGPFRDYLRVGLDKPQHVLVLELVPPTAPESVRVTVERADGDPVTLQAVEGLVVKVREAIESWLPQISFTAKVPCPFCNGDDGDLDVTEMHLDLVDILTKEHLHCPHHGKTIKDELLPTWLSEPRRERLERGPLASPPPDAVKCTARHAADHGGSEQGDQFPSAFPCPNLNMDSRALAGKSMPTMMSPSSSPTQSSKFPTTSAAMTPTPTSSTVGPASTSQHLSLSQLSELTRTTSTTTSATFASASASLVSVPYSQASRPLSSSYYSSFYSQPSSSVSALQQQSQQQQLQHMQQQHMQQQPMLRMTYLYSSPLGSTNQELGVASEIQALSEIPGIDAQISVGTIRELQQALRVGGVVHISAHATPEKASSEQAVLLENDYGAASPQRASDLADCGPWAGVQLLVFLACSSKRIVERLYELTNLEFPALCLQSDVHDSVAERFFKVFYRFVADDYPLQECLKWAKSTIRSDFPGWTGQADSFVLLGREDLITTCLRANGRNAFHNHPAHFPGFVPRPSVQHYLPQSRSELGISLARFLDSKESRAMRVTGPSGIGKTAFCRDFCRYFSYPGRLFSLATIYISVEELEQLNTSSSEYTFREGFAEIALQNNVNEFSPVRLQASEDFAGYWDDFMRWVRMLNHEKGLWLIVLDGVQALSETSREIMQRLLDSLLNTSGTLRILLTGRPESATDPQWGRIGTSHTKVAQATLPPLPLHHAAAMFLASTRRHLCRHDFFQENIDWESKIEDRKRVLELLQAQVYYVVWEIPSPGDGTRIHGACYPVSEKEAANREFQRHKSNGLTDRVILADGNFKTLLIAGDPQVSENSRIAYQNWWKKNRVPPLLEQLGGLPRAIQEAADLVTEQLPSLRNHPNLKRETE